MWVRGSSPRQFPELLFIGGSWAQHIRLVGSDPLTGFGVRVLAMQGTSERRESRGEDCLFWSDGWDQLGTRVP